MVSRAAKTRGAGGGTQSARPTLPQGRAHRPAVLARAAAGGRAVPPGRADMEPGLEELMPRLLPVDDCDLAEDFDPTVPPRTPQEYLKRVQ